MLYKRYNKSELVAAALKYLNVGKNENREAIYVLIDKFSILIGFEKVEGGVIAEFWNKDGISVSILRGETSISYYEIRGLDALVKWYRANN